MKNLISILFYLVANSIFAQSTIYQPSTAARVAYMGSIIHPGFKVGIERPYKIFEVKKEVKPFLKNVDLRLIWDCIIIKHTIQIVFCKQNGF